MSTLDKNAIALARLEEAIRQQRETFNQRQRHESQWFKLRLAMGFAALLILPAVLGISSYILLNYKDYSGAVVTAAGAALFGDILGVILSVWKIVIDQNSMKELLPVTSIDNELWGNLESGPTIAATTSETGQFSPGKH